MKPKILAIILILFACKIDLKAQQEKSILDWLNDNDNYPFMPAGEIKGIGMLRANDYYDKELKVYDEQGNVLISIFVNDTNSITKIDGKTYNYYNYYDTITGNYYHDGDSITPLNSWFFLDKPDYFGLIFQCKSIEKNYYKVIIDEKTGRTGFIKKNDKNFKFQSYKNFVSDYISLGFAFNRTTNPLLTINNDKAKPITSPLQKKYKIWQANPVLDKNGFAIIKGNWVKVKIETEIGWVRWRNGNMIIIEIYYVC